MARGEQSRTETMLEEAIEDVLRVATGWFWLVVGLGFAGMAMALLALLNRLMFFTFVSSSLDPETLISALVCLILVGTVMVAFANIQKVALVQISNYMARRLAVPAVLATAQRAGRPETLASSALNDIEIMRSALAGPGSAALVAATVTPPLIALAFVIHWSFGALALFYSLAAGVLSLLITRAKKQALEAGGGGQARATGLAADAIRSGEAVLAMGMLPRLAGQWIEVTTAAAGEAWLADRRASRLRVVLDMMMGSFRGVFIVMSAIMIANGEVRLGVGIGAVFVILAIPQPFQAIGDFSTEIAAGLAAWQRLKNMVRGSSMPPDGLAFPCHEGRLTAERLGFGFRGPTPPLFRGVDLEVQPGEIVAIIGPSGSGKSTLLRLLIGMLRPNSGGVYLDGCSVGQWDRRDLARHLGFLPQEALLSRGTAAEVISRLEIPEMPLVLDAARRAGAHETIVGLELGYATIITGQHQLSMGQRHRIAIARAIYGRPKVVVMDELAASLDAEGEADIARLLAVLREEGTAVIFTTHRPGLLAMADRVLAIRNGMLVPAGTDGDAARLEGPRRRVPQLELARGEKGRTA